MAIDFPSSPTVGDVYSYGGATWQWNGVAWDGISSSQGSQGTTGSQGLTGIQGAVGIQGSDGLQGIQGPQGTTGIQGAIGTQGSTGAQGTQGVQGVQGTTGIQGETGTQGITGSQGTTGTQGLTGIQGNTGAQGTIGIQGITGTQGIQGLIGSQGTQGIQGVQGTQGTQGIQGVQGTQGTIGINWRGAYAQAQTYAIGDGVVWLGSSWIAIAAVPINTFPSDANPTYWELLAAQGTEGVQGLTGIQGTQGLQGNQGTQGIQGNQGTTGIQGTQGLQGSQGLQGVQGTQGTTGIQGLTGTQGATGTQGTQGIQGVQGIQSTQGTQGIQGVNGQIGAAPVILTVGSGMADPLILNSSNNNGGAGYGGISRWVNQSSGTTNGQKYWRINPTGALEVVNSAYTGVIFTIEDSGALITGSINGATVNADAWADFVPSLRTNSGTITLGNGTIDASYKNIGKTCEVRYKFTVGSTTSIGSGEIIFGLPLTAKNSNFNFAGAALDNGVAWYSVTGVGSYLGSTTEFAMLSYSGTGKTFNGVSNTSMFNLLSGDYIVVSGTYEIA